MGKFIRRKEAPPATKGDPDYDPLCRNNRRPQVPPITRRSIEISGFYNAKKMLECGFPYRPYMRYVCGPNGEIIRSNGSIEICRRRGPDRIRRRTK